MWTFTLVRPLPLPFHIFLSSGQGSFPKNSHLSFSGPGFLSSDPLPHSFLISSFLLCLFPRPSSSACGFVIPLCLFLLNLHCKRDMMAVASLFTFASLTDGRAARDLPKQHPEKKTRFAKCLLMWWKPLSSYKCVTTAVDVACGTCVTWGLTNLNSRWGVKHLLGRCLPQCIMSDTLFHACTVGQLVPDPCTKDDLPALRFAELSSLISCGRSVCCSCVTLVLA